MSTIILCALNDVARLRGVVSTITVKRLGAYPSMDLLAPTKALVWGYKSGTGDTRFARYPSLTEEQYTDGYRELIEARMPRITQWYRELPEDNNHELTLCCYCPAGNFCHRQLVAKLFGWLNRRLGLSHVIELY